MKDFVYNGQPSRVVFGPGSLAHLEREIELLGAKRALVLSTRNRRRRLRWWPIAWATGLQESSRER